MFGGATFAPCTMAMCTDVRAMLYAGATAAILALLSKPAAVAVPLMAGVLGIGLLRRRPTLVFLELLPWVGCAAVAIAITKGLQPGRALVSVKSLATRRSLPWMRSVSMWPSSLCR